VGAQPPQRYDVGRDDQQGPEWVGGDEEHLADGVEPDRCHGEPAGQLVDVSEFGDLEKKAEAYAEEHPEQADKGTNEVAGFAECDTDHQHDEQIDRAVDAAEQYIGQGQDQQGNQD
jgi:hypothetical protein